MKMTFTPAPGSPWRVVKADDPQPAESWACDAPNKVIAPPKSDLPEANTPCAGDAGPGAASATSTVPTPCCTDAVAQPEVADFLDPLPPLSCSNCSDRTQFYQARQQASFYRVMFNRCREREDVLKEELAEARAEIRMLKQRLFGTSSETCNTPDRPASTAPTDPLAESATPSAEPEPSSTPSAQPRRKRGQQPGNPHPQRRDYSHLPTYDEEVSLPPEQTRCPCCGEQYAPNGFDEPVFIIEVVFEAFRRRIRRRRYLRRCECPDQPEVITAPKVPRVLPHSQYGISIWTQTLLDKFEYCRPTNKLLSDLCSHDLDLSVGTLTSNLKRLAPLFEPLYENLIKHSRDSTLWNADETRWRIFQLFEGKTNNRCYFWLFESEDAVVFTLDKGRAHDVPETHFSDKAKGIVVVDRYSAYKAMKHVKEGRLTLAFCWAHQRRDFLGVEKSWPKLATWAQQWLARIGELYGLNNQRRATLPDKARPFAKLDKQVKQAVQAIKEKMEEELKDEKLHPAQRKVLESMQEHWSGLTVFVDVPEVPMDNNQAERTLRIAALARKSFYGNAAQWSGKLTACMFSILATLKKWGINRRKWLQAYLQACAEAGGKVPADVDKWLPWNLSEEQKKVLAEDPEEEEEE